MLAGSDRQHSLAENDLSDLFELYFKKNPNRVKGDSPIFISGEETITFHELPNLIRKCAYNLQKHFGIKKGDVVAIRSLPHINYPLVFHGVIYAGGIVASVRQAPGDDLDSIFQEIDVVKPKLFIFGSKGSDLSLEAASKARISKTNILLLDDTRIDGLNNVSNILLSGNDLANPCAYTVEEFENHCSLIFFTSGSTGKKKATQATNKAIVYWANSVYKKRNRSQKLLANRPLSYGSTTMSTLVSSIICGDEVYISQVEDINDICQAIEKYKISTYSTSPFVMIRMLKEEVYKKYNLSSLTSLSVGGSVMTKPALEQAAKCFGIPILYLYGSSEIFTPFCTTPEMSLEGVVGRLNPDYTARLVDEDDNDAGLDQPGELLVKGPTITKGYYKNPEATAKAFTKDGFYRSGDLFLKVGNDKYKFVSRRSHWMKYNSTHISPHDIEKVVLKHPKVADCGVIGVYSNEKATELPRAYVILVNQDDYSNKESIAKDILEYANSQLPEMKRIRAGVIIKETLPRTVSEKIKYNVLKQEAAAE